MAATDEDFPVTVDEFMLDSATFVIGRGGYGTVHGNPKYPQFAVKRLHDEGECEIGKEDEYQTDISLRWEEFTKDDGSEFANLINVPKIHNMVVVDNHCHIVMDRVCPIVGLEKYDCEVGDNSIHANFGIPQRCDMYPGRGAFIGRNILKNYVDLEIYAKATATFMAFLHFEIGYDGLDLEFIIGSSCLEPNENIRLYVIDFGMVGTSTTANSRSKSLTDIPYFPMGDSYSFDKAPSEELEKEETELGDIFWETYSDFAKSRGETDKVVEDIKELSVL